MTKMMYGNTTPTSTIGISSAVSLGLATANGTLTLSERLSAFQFVGIATYVSSAYLSFDIMPVAFFKNPTFPYYKRLDTNGTYRRVQVGYASDTTVTISNRTSLNVEIVGIKVG